VGWCVFSRKVGFLIHITWLYTIRILISLNVFFFNFSKRVIATDNKGLSSESIEVEIILCSGCSNHGSCDYGLTRNQTGDYFKIASCICQAEYTGKDYLLINTDRYYREIKIKLKLNRALNVE